jgi:hypothetical protein
MSDTRSLNTPISPPEDEEVVMAQIQKYSELTERSLDMIERLLQKGYAMNSPEVKRLQQKLHELEVKSNFWRNRMMKYL